MQRMPYSIESQLVHGEAGHVTSAWPQKRGSPVFFEAILLCKAAFADVVFLTSNLPGDC